MLKILYSNTELIFIQLLALLLIISSGFIRQSSFRLTEAMRVEFPETKVGFSRDSIRVPD